MKFGSAPRCAQRLRQTVLVDGSSVMGAAVRAEAERCGLAGTDLPVNCLRRSASDFPEGTA